MIPALWFAKHLQTAATWDWSPRREWIQGHYLCGTSLCLCLQSVALASYRSLGMSIYLPSDLSSSLTHHTLTFLLPGYCTVAQVLHRLRLDIWEVHNSRGIHLISFQTSKIWVSRLCQVTWLSNSLQGNGCYQRMMIHLIWRQIPSSNSSLLDILLSRMQFSPWGA